MPLIMADTKGGGMESSVPMIMGGRKAIAFQVRIAGREGKRERELCARNPMVTLRQDAPIFFDSIISLLNFYGTLAVFIKN